MIEGLVLIAHYVVCLGNDAIVPSFTKRHLPPIANPPSLNRKQFVSRTNVGTEAGAIVGPLLNTLCAHISHMLSKKIFITNC